MLEFEQANLISWARHLARKGKLQDLLDPALQSMDQDQALLCITVAFLCLQRSPIKRPSIKEVVRMLSEVEKRIELELQLTKDREIREKELDAERQASLTVLKRHEDQMTTMQTVLEALQNTQQAPPARGHD
ncbi:hypothetical protein GIB67_007163 [Kingdonia uniflora]|uniref:Uncharacterized protein n=1 Tax=Kingdonia uniflora TaxID=39325 RepID=A0A7J7MLG6_9MAGN|nr:hypothetical protein GIB67_007163 [Kingdonia uniflora]